LERNVHDYAIWDDSYVFVSAPSAKYLEANLNPDVMANLRITHALIFNRYLELVTGRTLDAGSAVVREVAPGFAQQVAPAAATMINRGRISSSGLLRIGDDLYIAAACRILPMKTDRPFAGIYVYLKRVEAPLIREISESLRIGLSVSMDGGGQALLADGQDKPGYSVLRTTSDQLRVAIPLLGVTNQTVCLAETVLPRTIQQQARYFITLAWIALFATLVTSALLWPLAIRWLVLNRLEQIHHFMTLLGREKPLTERLPAREGDELDALAVSINKTLDTIETAQGQRDVSESRSRHLQEQLTQIQKVEALATMAGGIAHDFNNSLGSIMGSIELVQQELQPGHPAHRHLERMQKAGSGACALARQMLNLSRSSPVQRSPIHLGDAVSDVLRLVRAGLPKTIEIHFQSTAFDDVVLADTTQLQQVVMNLATNASHAMASLPKGRIEVTIDEVTLPCPGAPPETITLPAGEYVRLAFSDNGQGIPKENINKVFDPFFTTKPVGSGTGLGLAVARGFVAQHGGSLGLQSEAGHGATFHIHLPKCHAPSLSSHPTGAGHLKILLVDDDTYGRETMAEGLRKAGHLVTEAASGAAALRLVEEGLEAFDAVVTDQIMPGMTGMDLSEQLSRRIPETPVFLISGYTGPIDEKSLRGKGILRLFMKPVVISELDGALRKSGQQTRPNGMGS
jgi:signal transduction histidine kinase/CheY-like chemotaxis protein